MDRSNVLTLIDITYTPDALGQLVPTESSRDVYCDVTSVSAREWFEGGRNGIAPMYRVNMFAYDYEDEEIVEFEGTRYGVYRTYRGSDDTIELYLERKAGV